MKYIHIASTVCIACSAFAGGIYAANYKTESQLALDACAKEHWVYACTWATVPVRAPHEVKVQVDLLPPPAGE